MITSGIMVLRVLLALLHLELIHEVDIITFIVYM